MLFIQQRRHIVIQFFALLGVGGTHKAGAISLVAIPGQRELADQQQLSFNIRNGAIHFVLIVAKDAQTGELAGHPAGFFFRVALLNSQQNAQTRTDGCMITGGFDIHSRLRHALYDGNHEKIVRMHPAKCKLISVKRNGGAGDHRQTLLVTGLSVIKQFDGLRLHKLKQGGHVSDAAPAGRVAVPAHGFKKFFPIARDEL